MVNIAMIAEIAAEGGGERIALGDAHDGTTYLNLWDGCRRAAGWLKWRGRDSVGMIGVNSRLFPTALFGAALAGRAFSPLNYRWSDRGLLAAIERLGSAVVIVDDEMLLRLNGISSKAEVDVVSRSQFLNEVESSEPAGAIDGEPERPAVLLFTSGTSGIPKVAVLRHEHLSSYIFGTVELMAADDGDTQLLSLPPYHVGGIANLLSTLYSGRRIVQMAAFDPYAWIETVRSENVTHASVVPTMLARIISILAEKRELELPSLRHLSYGGGRMPLPVLREAMRLLPHTGFVNGYGLTETSSTITVLDPKDHRTAAVSQDPAVRARLGSVGRALPTVELSVRDADGNTVEPGAVGELYVRGDQVSGQYIGADSEWLEGGWFRTKDAARIDEAGYVFVEGRLDDVIVRGGENISPGEVEDALMTHPHVSDAGVVGLPDDEWGEMVVAAVVVSPGNSPEEAELREWVSGQLRSSKAPTRVKVVASLPYNDNGKLVRRQLREQLAAQPQS